MITLVIRSLLLVSFFLLFIEAADSTNCIPDYFRYVHNDMTNEFSGRVEIPEPPKGVPLYITVKMSLAATLPTKYVGRIELEHSRYQSVKAIEQGRPLTYVVRFPLREPVPNVNEIWFNGVQICVGRRATGYVVTSIFLNHTLYPPGVPLLTVDDMNVDPCNKNVVDSPSQDLSPETTTTSRLPFRPTPTPRPTPPPRPAPTPRPTTLKPVSPIQPGPHVVDVDTQQECGRFNASGINFLIAGGEKINRGEYPWLAAIFLVLVPRYKFHCAGSLVTPNHIITAAHCFVYQKTTLPIGAMVVSLGRFKLLDFEEAGSVNREVAGYTIHPDYPQSSGKSKASADADIAVMVLRTSVQYSPVIKPICLWSGAPSLDLVVKRFGIVVGWGRDELGNVYLEEPRMVRTPIVSQDTCLFSKKEFVFIASDRTFCAGSGDGTGPCNGDSGSGFALYDANVDRYFLRGVVSLSFLDKTNMSCDLTNYVVYVDVAKHLDWIYQQLSLEV